MAEPNQAAIRSGRDEDIERLEAAEKSLLDVAETIRNAGINHDCPFTLKWVNAGHMQIEQGVMALKKAATEGRRQSRASLEMVK